MKNRKDYWNEEYYQYWKARVDESNKSEGKSDIIIGDYKTYSDDVYNHIFNKNLFNKGNILEIGCAWGRMFNLYNKNNLEIFGIDISSKMIEEAKKNWKKSNLYVSEAENLQFKSNYFDNIACLGTFDALNQVDALNEFIRVAKVGCKLYLTGKNIRYDKDNDKEAVLAEKGAKKKNEPNFFTNVEMLISDLKDKDHLILDQFFFKKRGDFSKLNFSKKFDKLFYEFFLVIKLSSNKNKINFEYLDYSK